MADADAWANVAVLFHGFRIALGKQRDEFLHGQSDIFDDLA